MSSRAARASRGDRCAPRCWRSASTRVRQTAGYGGLPSSSLFCDQPLQKKSLLLSTTFSSGIAQAARLTGQIADALQQALEKVRIAREAADADQRKANALLEQISGITAAMEARTRRLRTCDLRFCAYAEEWTIAAGDTPPTSELRDALPQRLAQSTEQLAKGAIELSSAARILPRRTTLPNASRRRLPTGPSFPSCALRSSACCE